MPQVALGSWKVSGPSEVGETAYIATKRALELGYRHFDTSWNYGTQVGIGRALAESNLPRKELFVTTKLSDMINCSDPFQDATRQVSDSLRELQLDFVDVVLIHHPATYSCNLAAYRALEVAHRAGLVVHLGVSNFCVSQLDHLFIHADVPPAVHQAVGET